MKISVVIPAYNEEKMLGKCLEAISKQSLLPDEVIVVDNNSVDKTVDVAKSFPFVKLVRETEQGMIPARNRGVSEATGDVVVRCDADTIAYRHWIEVIKKSFENKDIDAMSGPADYYDLPLKPFFTKLQTLVFFDTWRFFKKTELMFGSNMAFKKTIWNKVLPSLAKHDPEMHEDMDIAIHIARAGGKILYNPKMKVSISARRFTNQWYSLPDYLRRYFKAFFV
ncbi:MAG: glycosyltransferase family A protein [Patescibacteria group bacterium]